MGVGKKPTQYTGVFLSAYIEQDIWRAHRKAWINFASGEVGSSCPVDNSRFHFPDRMVTQQGTEFLNHHNPPHQNNGLPANLLTTNSFPFSSKDISSWSQLLVWICNQRKRQSGVWEYDLNTVIPHVQGLRRAISEWADRGKGQRAKTTKRENSCENTKCRSVRVRMCV